MAAVIRTYRQKSTYSSKMDPSDGLAEIEKSGIRIPEKLSENHRFLIHSFSKNTEYFFDRSKVYQMLYFSSPKNAI